MASNNTFNNLGALPFMRKYPLIPDGNDNAVASTHGAYSHVPKALRVSYMVISPGTHYSLAALTLLQKTAGIPNREGDPQKAICYQADDAGNTRIPVFWLPYKQNSNYRITLEPNIGDPQPDFFLTAAVDGCSVYVEGTRAKPTVHHLNAANTKFHPLNGSAPFGTTGNYAKDSLAFMTKDAHMTQELKSSPEPKTVQNAVAGLQPGKYIKNDDYMLRSAAALKQEKQLLSTPARSVDNQRRVDKTDMMTQGTVFGIRDPVANEWTFYFQRRVVAILYKNNNHQIPFVKSDYVAIGYRMYPALIREFWPTGGGSLFVRP